MLQSASYAPGPTMKRIMPRAQGRAYQNSEENIHISRLF